MVKRAFRWIAVLCAAALFAFAVVAAVFKKDRSIEPDLSFVPLAHTLYRENAGYVFKSKLYDVPPGMTTADFKNLLDTHLGGMKPDQITPTPDSGVIYLDTRANESVTFMTDPIKRILLARRVEGLEAIYARIWIRFHPNG